MGPRANVQPDGALLQLHRGNDSQANIARRCGISRRTWVKLENSEIVSFAAVEKVARVLRVRTEEIALPVNSSPLNPTAKIVTLRIPDGSEIKAFLQFVRSRYPSAEIYDAQKGSIVLKLRLSESDANDLVSELGNLRQFVVVEQTPHRALVPSAPLKRLGRPRRRKWFWFFLLFFALASATTGIMLPRINRPARPIRIDETKRFEETLRRLLIGDQQRQTRTVYRRNSNGIGHDTWVDGVIEATDVRLTQGAIERYLHPARVVGGERTEPYQELHAVATIEVPFRATSTARKRLFVSPELVQSIGLSDLIDDEKNGLKMEFGYDWKNSRTEGVLTMNITYSSIENDIRAAMVHLSVSMSREDRPHQFTRDVLVTRHLRRILIEAVQRTGFATPSGSFTGCEVTTETCEPAANLPRNAR